MPRLVLVTGPPGAGKTTLARPLAARLGVPLIAKDDVKDALLRTLGARTREESAALGAAAWQTVFALAAAAPRCVLEGNLDADRSSGALRALCAEPIEVFCRCDPETAMRRYAERAGSRHAGHFDEQMIPSLRARLAARPPAPLSLGPVLEVDTGEPCDVETVARWIEAEPSWAPNWPGSGRPLPNS